MRINLTKKDLVNIIYMQVGFSKQITENLIEEFFSIIVSNLCKKKNCEDIKVWNIFNQIKKFKNWQKSKNQGGKRDF